MPRVPVEADFAAVKRDSAVRADALEPWAGYFERRTSEYLRAYQVAVAQGMRMTGARALDVGAGVGFSSRLLSVTFERVIAFDRPNREPAPHSVGLSQAEAYLRATRSGADPISLVAGDATALPFGEAQFDLVFTSFAMQYVGKRDRAAAEMRRVLRPDGALILLVPTGFERLLTWYEHYPDLGKRLFSKITTRARRPRERGSAAPVSPDRAPTDRAPALERLWSSLWPRADHPYRSTLDQIEGQRLVKWRGIVERSGFEILAVEPLWPRLVAIVPFVIIVARPRAGAK